MEEPAGRSDGKKIPLITIEGKEFEVPIGGSIGLLALGYRGLMIWRERLAQANSTISQKRTE
jgi:hypothetical protein